MTLFIDSREKNYKLAQALASTVECEYVTSDAGDFLISKPDNTILAIERMTILDFLGKIKSDRMKAQLSKLREISSEYYLLIENPWMLKKTKWNLKSVIGLLAQLHERNRVFMSYNFQWSLYFVLYHYKKNGSEAVIKNSDVRAKPKDMTAKEQAVFALSGLAGIGESTAMKLLMHYGTLETIATMPADELREVVNGKLAQNVYNVFHQKFEE